jgi:hypothetical protein
MIAAYWKALLRASIKICLYAQVLVYSLGQETLGAADKLG